MRLRTSSLIYWASAARSASQSVRITKQFKSKLNKARRETAEVMAKTRKERTPNWRQGPKKSHRRSRINLENGGETKSTCLLSEHVHFGLPFFGSAAPATSSSVNVGVAERETRTWTWSWSWPLAKKGRPGVNSRPIGLGLHSDKNQLAYITGVVHGITYNCIPWAVLNPKKSQIIETKKLCSFRR